MRKKQKSIVLYTIKLKTANIYTGNLMKKYLLDLNLCQIITQPTKHKYFYKVIRSPHVNKNSQEDFNLVYYNYTTKISPKTQALKTLESKIKFFLMQTDLLSGRILKKKTIKFNSFF